MFLGFLIIHLFLFLFLFLNHVIGNVFSNCTMKNVKNNLMIF